MDMVNFHIVKFVLAIAFVLELVVAALAKTLPKSLETSGDSKWCPSSTSGIPVEI
jgi:hypothetical protein